MFRIAAALLRPVQLLLVLAILVNAQVAALAEPVTPLISADWLKERLRDPNLLVLDVRSALDGGGAEAYRRAHIPGAVHSDYDKAGWRVTRNGVAFMLPSLPELEKLIGETGIDEDIHVVIVPAGVHATDFGAAARTYWTLKVAGHDRVSILDGGFAAWVDASLPIEQGARAASPRIFTANFDKTHLAEIGEVEAAIRAGDVTLIDARAPNLYSGKEKAPQAGAYGHIPGAVNIDNASLYDPRSNRLKSKDELAAVLASVGSSPVIAYCNTGHWAATVWFAMSELLGRKDVKLFAGSMVEWTAEPHRPVASARTKWDDLMKALGLGS